MAYLSEGNHRLGLASELGRAVPVVVYRSTKTAPDHPMKPLTEPGEFSMRDGLGFMRFPEVVSPSAIGLPTVRGERDFTRGDCDRTAIGRDRFDALDASRGIAQARDSDAGLDF
jgi:hypothetical protein